MKNHYFFILFFAGIINFNQCNLHATETDAFCCVPVAELVAYPLLQSTKGPFNSYEKIPCQFFSKTTGIPRLGQLIFNEQVKIVEKKGQEVRVTIPHRYYVSMNNTPLNNGFWMDGSNLYMLDELSKNNLEKIPQPLSYLARNNFSENVIVLIEPWTIFKESLFSKRHTTYSAGTRFVRTTQHKEQEGHYAVYVFNPGKRRFEVQDIPHNLCILEDQQRDNSEKRKIFVGLIRRWTYRPNNKYFAYVFGGSSLVEDVEPQNFALQKAGTHEKLFFIRPHHKEQEQSFNTHYLTQTGIDCSNLISRAAQIAGIPYYAGNTSTIKHELKPLTKDDILEVGDIVGWKGHVIIISSIKNNLIIEARGYEPSAYGIVHEIPLSERFKDINTMQELLDAYFSGKKVARLTKSGKVKEVIKEGISIYKLL